MTVTKEIQEVNRVLKWWPYLLVRLVRKFNQSFIYSLKQEKHEAASLPQVQGWVSLAIAQSRAATCAGP